MSALDEITREKQRLSEALARVDAQRERLSSQLSELEATERVLARHTRGSAKRKSASVQAPSPVTPARPSRRQRSAAARSPGKKRTTPNLTDQVLALANGKSQQEIAAACKGARPNHVGAAIARHKRAGRLEERDGKLYATHSAGTEQRAAV
jgi:type II secretory pathway component HofQ